VLGAGWHFAQFNVARLRQPLDHPDTAAFVAALDEVNAVADASPGFVWRLTDAGTGLSSSYVRAYDDPLMIINLSVWETPEDLQAFVYRGGHTPYLRRRREWFERLDDDYLVCWWVPAGQLPTVDEAVARLESLRADGVSDEAFTLRSLRPAPAGNGREAPRAAEPPVPRSIGEAVRTQIPR
jgi:Domain of unknown function (DUF3291)